MCIRCHKNLGSLENKIIDYNGERSYCPNCLAIAYFNEELNLVNSDDFVCDIKQKKGAIKFVSERENYILNKKTMLRLISHNLKPDEYLKLVEKYGSHGYMIHDDFYTEDGIAIQPMDVI